MILRWIKHFARSEQGSALPLIALGVFMLIGATGTAIDMGRVQIVQSRLQSALDAAGLAVGSEINGSANINTEFSKYFYANFPANYLGATITTLTITPNADNSVFTLVAAGTVNTAFMQLFGVNTVNLSATSQITRQSSGMELVLVLDNTGSMNCLVTNESSCGGGSGSKIATLKTAAATLLDILYGNSNNTVNNLWVGVVPFSQAVNIGTGYPGWMDSNYDATLEFGPTVSGTSCQKYTGTATTLTGGSNFNGAAATGVITFTNNPSNGNTIALNGVTWTFVSGTATGNQTKIGSNLSTTMTSLASNLGSSTNASIKTASYYATSNALDITYKTTGSAGNAYTLASGNANAVVTAPTSNGTYAAGPECTYTLAGNGAATSFIQMGNWGGCVMARTAPYDTSDDPPATALFQAYDYPPTTDAGETYDPWITFHTTHSGSPAVYTTTTSYFYNYISSYPGYYGPNLFCPQPVQPMVAEKSTVINTINSLTAGGSTLIDIGMAWGQRMLSPRWRGLWGGEMNTNSLPLNYNTPLMNKVLILMTDGENELDPGNFTAYQYLDSGVLGTTTFATANSDLDTKTLAICTSLKNNGVIIYTIGFGTQSDVNTSLLTSCATDASHFFLTPSNAQLTAAFQQIGDALANLRVSQ